MSTTFESLGLAAPLLRALADLGFTQPTSVQAQAIPAALEGGDWMVSSQTGSGKTAAFLLPVLHPMIGFDNRPSAKGPTALVLCPTRELAQQVMADAIELLRPVKGLRVACVVGGMPYGRQMTMLKGAALVVATPGRLLDLAERGHLRLDQVQRLVVDEADRMLDLGFAPDLEAIHRLCAQRRQTLMFSATFEARVRSLAATMMNEPGALELASVRDVHSDITQRLHWADDVAHKLRLLTHTLSDPQLDQAVVFASTQADTETLADELRNLGHEVAALHGAMPQALRNRRLKGLRDGHIRVLVATDVAARGIDVPSISHVVNFGLPMKAEDYVHRIGRTGRAGRSGTAVTLAEPRDRARIRAIERLTQQPIEAVVIPGMEPRPPARRGPRPEGARGARPGSGRPGMGERRFDERRSEYGDRGGRFDGERRPAPAASGFGGHDRFGAAAGSHERTASERAPRWRDEAPVRERRFDENGPRSDTGRSFGGEHGAADGRRAYFKPDNGARSGSRPASALGADGQRPAFRGTRPAAEGDRSSSAAPRTGFRGRSNGDADNGAGFSANRPPRFGDSPARRFGDASAAPRRRPGREG